jgi:nucleotide-binding universal stress UspA family protein
MRGIIVGVDGSEASVEALRWALAEARLRAVDRVVVVHAFRPPEERSPFANARSVLPESALHELAEQEGRWAEERELAARRHAEAVVERSVASAGGPVNGVAIEHVVVAREPAGTLIEMSADADLLVVGSRGRGGFTGLLLGSVSQQCLQHARCPVVVIR